MKRIFLVMIITVRSAIAFASSSPEILDGDIVFQESKSSQSKAIQIATKSKYSHMGMIYRKGKKLFVLEAVQPVKLTLFANWISRGVDKGYVVKRLKQRDELLTPSVLSKVKSEGRKFIGKDYDSSFEWSDDRIYCSELVWKTYFRATGIEIGKTRVLSEFDISDPLVKKKLEERYGNSIPLNEKVIAPVDIFQSDLLETILEN